MSLIVITGSSGFIGYNIATYYLNKINNNFDILQDESCIDTNILCTLSDLESTQNTKNYLNLLHNPKTRYIDYSDLLNILDKLPERPIAIIHNGACSSTEETNENIFQELNLNYTKKIWNYCTLNKIPLIYASSASVYGDGSLGFSDKIADCSKYKPLNLYAKSKLDFDLWALEQANTPPVWFGLRYFNVYGEHEEHKNRQASMVFHAYNQIKKTGKVKLYKSNFANYADGEQKRDFIYVKDIVKITDYLINLSNKTNHTNFECNGFFVNIGTGTPRSWNSLINNIFTNLKIKINIEYIDMPENLAKQYQNYTCADISTLKTLMPNFNPTKLEIGVKNYIDYLEKNYI